MLTEEQAKRLDEAMKTFQSEGKLDPFIIEFIFDCLKQFDEFGKLYNEGAFGINLRLSEFEYRMKKIENMVRGVKQCLIL